MEAGTIETVGENKRSRRIIKMVAGVAAMLVVIAALTGAVAAISSRTDSYDVKTLSEKMQTIISSHHSSNNNNNREKRQGYTACESEVNNETVPAAHIEGYRKWKDVASSDDSSSETYIPGYVTSWKCIGDSGGPFVDGGMKFDNQQKALIVPTCGYYYISSSVTFSPSVQGSVFHKLRITQDCPETSRRQIEAIGYASTSIKYKYVTSHVEEVVMLCENSQIQVIIPSTVPCCGYGGASYMNMFLVAESNCSASHAREHAMLVF